MTTIKMRFSKMLFFLCFSPTIKFQGGSPVDPLFEPPADPPFWLDLLKNYFYRHFGVSEISCLASYFFEGRARSSPVRMWTKGMHGSHHNKARLVWGKGMRARHFKLIVWQIADYLENNSDYPHPPYLQKICPQNMPYNGGPYGIKVG